MQTSLELVEATARPARHGNASERTRGRGLRTCEASKRCCLVLPLFESDAACALLVRSLYVNLRVSFGISLVIMAHSSSYVSVPSDRSRRPTDSWNYTPLLRQTRRVLAIIDPTQVQYLVTARQSDAMQITTCDALPTLGSLEEYALFTYRLLVAPAETQILTVETILSYISQHIKNTWGVYLEPSSMDLRWSDCTGGMFIIRNHQTLIDLLRAHRPHWTEGQDLGILFNAIKDFDRRKFRS